MAKRRVFGHTWWGRAWISALENRASLDPNRLPRGRTYARKDAVLDLTVEPGQVRALVKGSRPTPYRVKIRLTTFDDDQWERVFVSIGAQLGRLAALLDGELPTEIVADVAAAGLDLLPGAGEVRPSCSCPDWADPCKHSAAVCYLIADEVDLDPFALFLLRGRSRDEVLSELRSRRGPSSTAAVAPVRRKPDGVVAKRAYADEPADPAPLPVPPLPPDLPGLPAPLAADPPPSSGLRTADLSALVADAAGRAWEAATGLADGGLDLTFEQDLARRAAVVVGRADLTALARRAGVNARMLAEHANAWQKAGAGGVDILTADWTPPAESISAAKAALTAWGGRARVTRNRLTCGDVQLRHGLDGRWYRLVRPESTWILDGPPADDPADLLGD